MGYNDTVARPEKDIAREWAVTSKNPVSVYVTLPSVACLDVKSGLRLGTLNRKTKIIACEMDQAKIPPIEAFLSTRFSSFAIHDGSLDTMPLRELAGRSIDLAFFDLCGTWGTKETNWMLAFNGSEFKKGANLSFTVSRCFRNGDLSRTLRPITSAPKYVTFRRWFDKAGNKLQVNPNDMDDILVTCYALWASLSANYVVSLKRVFTYCDTKTPMMLIQIVVNRKTRQPGNKATRHLAKLCRGEKPTGLKLWQVIGCPADFTAGMKAAEVRYAKRGLRPPWMKPQLWAHNPLNPNGIK